MPANTFGELFSITTFGESHGKLMGVVVDGCPPGLALSEEDIQPDLDRRRPGQSKYTTQRKEADAVEIVSGVFEGKTTGTPIAMLVRNSDQRSGDYDEIKEKLRPNHADYTYLHKYGLRDYRGSGRASARETVCRVAAGAVAKKYLKEKGKIKVEACLVQMGDICVQPGRVNWDAVNDNPFFCGDPGLVSKMEELIGRVRKDRDSVGAKLLVRATGVPVGLGAPVYSRLDADLASALMGINAVKAVGIGDGMEAAAARGSSHRDEMSPRGFHANHSGGIVGGVSTGQDILATLALKPTSSIPRESRSIDIRGEPARVATYGRHDPCVGLRAVPIAEAMVAIVLMDHYLRHRAQNADVKPPFPPIPADGK